MLAEASNSRVGNVDNGNDGDDGGGAGGGGLDRHDGDQGGGQGGHQAGGQDESEEEQWRKTRRRDGSRERIGQTPTSHRSVLKTIITMIHKDNTKVVVI